MYNSLKVVVNKAVQKKQTLGKASLQRVALGVSIDGRESGEVGVDILGRRTDYTG